MNIALPAIVAFFVFLPGVIARVRFMLIGHELLPDSPFSRIVIEVVLLSAIFHIVWISGSMVLLDKYLLMDPFLHLLGSEPAQQSRSISIVAYDAKWVFLYFVTLIPACWIIPATLRDLIIWGRLDSASSKWNRYFRFNDAHWYYLLSGRDEKKDPDLIFVSAIVQMDNTARLYEGYLSAYHLNKNGALDYISLKNVTRYNFKKYDDLNHFGTPIDSHVFILRYSEIITLNIKYLDIPIISSSENDTDSSKTQDIPPS